MKHIDQTIEIIKNFTFKKHDYIGAKEQLSQFSDSYAKLNLQEANDLRSIFKAKDRFGWLCVASTVFLELFPDANTLLKEELTKIFFAFYSFDNLDFGYDSVLYVIEVKKCVIEQHQTFAKKTGLYMQELPAALQQRITWRGICLHCDALFLMTPAEKSSPRSSD